MDREAWHAVIHGVAKSQTRLNNWTELRRLLKDLQQSNDTNWSRQRSHLLLWASFISEPPKFILNTLYKHVINKQVYYLSWPSLTSPVTGPLELPCWHFLIQEEQWPTVYMPPLVKKVVKRYLRLSEHPSSDVTELWSKEELYPLSHPGSPKSEC